MFWEFLLLKCYQEINMLSFSDLVPETDQRRETNGELTSQTGWRSTRLLTGVEDEEERPSLTHLAVEAATFCFKHPPSYLDLDVV